MRIFNFMYRLSKKGFFFTILYAGILSIIFALSISLILSKGINLMYTQEAIDEYYSEFGCYIDDYQLTCNDDYYIFGNLVIDLNRDGSTINGFTGTLLTKDMISVGGITYTYEEWLSQMNHHSSDFKYEDALVLFSKTKGTAVFIIFVIITFFTWIGHLIFNLLRTIINEILVKGFFKENIGYSNMYKLTFYAVTPLVIINAITRVAFNITIVGFITANLPFGGGLVRLALNSLIILWFTRLMLPNQNDKFEEVID
ncbi:DUF1189 family protein [Mycoplasmatota bacterium]|nr:DUF1189 family protein [Mycoplasmatota bacterium]